MAVNLFGNIDGKIYQPKTMDLFEKVKSQENQPVSVKEAVKEVKGDEGSMPIKLNISKEGLQALHGSKLKGSMNPDEVQKQIAYMSEHQPIESFRSRLSQGMLESYKTGGGVGSHSLQEKADALLGSFEKIYDEVFRGYEDGTRVRYIEDASAEDGFRKLSREEELEILQKEFDEFVDYRFGPDRQKQSEEVAKAMNDFQRIKWQLGAGGAEHRHYNPEVIPAGFAERMKQAARDFVVGYRKF